MKIPRQKNLLIASAAGFTLIELLISMAIMGVMLGIAIPAYNGMIADQKVRSVASMLHSSTLLARSEAIKRNGDVRVRPMTGGTWSGGWVIPNPATPNSDANPLFQERLAPGATISGGPTSLVFRASGRLRGVNNDPQFEIEADSDASKKRCLTIGLDGRVTTTVGEC